MAEVTEKRRQLDDEMSRFEAEISGPPNMDDLDQPHAANQRPIIGSNTFRQVQRQLQQTDIPNLQPPPEPPNLSNTTKSQARVPPPQDEPREGQKRSPKEALDRHIRPNPNLRSFNNDRQGSAPPSFSSQNNSLPGRGHSFSSGPQDMPQRGRNNYGPLPPPPPPSFMNQNRGHGRGNFSNPGMHPAPPPGFIPPQVNRSMGPRMGPMGPSRPPVSFLPPPPPPPGLLHQGYHPSKAIHGSPANISISKPAAIISSAAKLYLAPSKTADSPIIKGPAQPESNVVVEPKRKKRKIETAKVVEIPKNMSAVSIAQEMAEKVKQTIITTKLPPVQNTSSNHHNQPVQLPVSEEKKKEKKPRKNLRYAGGQIWEDSALGEWDHDDFRMFAGDLGNDVTDELLHRYFSHFSSFVKAKVVRDKRTNKSKGYGFVSFRDPQDYIRAMKEMNGKYVGSRPIKLRKSTWKDRSLDVVQRKMKDKHLQGLK